MSKKLTPYDELISKDGKLLPSHRMIEFLVSGGQINNSLSLQNARNEDERRIAEIKKQERNALWSTGIELVGNVAGAAVGLPGVGSTASGLFDVSTGNTGAGIGKIITGASSGIPALKNIDTSSFTDLFKNDKSKVKKTNTNTDTDLQKSPNIDDVLIFNETIEEEILGDTFFKKLGGGILPSKSVNGLIEFKGSDHKNKSGGIDMTPPGSENRVLVEAGETMYDGFVYTKSRTIPKEAVEAFKLPKNLKDKTFAEATLLLQKDLQANPNSQASKESFKVMMIRLKEAHMQVVPESHPDNQQMSSVNAAIQGSAMGKYGGDVKMLANGGNIKQGKFTPNDIFNMANVLSLALGGNTNSVKVGPEKPPVKKAKKEVIKIPTMFKTVNDSTGEALIRKSTDRVIIHRTAGKNELNEAQQNDWKKRNEGTQYWLETDGTLKLVGHPDAITNQSKGGVNKTSLGIEIVGKYNETTKTYDPLTPEQEETLKEFAIQASVKYNLTPDQFISHAEIPGAQKNEKEGLDAAKFIRKELEGVKKDENGTVILPPYLQLDDHDFGLDIPQKVTKEVKEAQLQKEAQDNELRKINTLDKKIKEKQKELNSKKNLSEKQVITAELDLYKAQKELSNKRYLNMSGKFNSFTKEQEYDLTQEIADKNLLVQISKTDNKLNQSNLTEDEIATIQLEKDVFEKQRQYNKSLRSEFDSPLEVLSKQFPNSESAKEQLTIAQAKLNIKVRESNTKKTQKQLEVEAQTNERNKNIQIALEKDSAKVGSELKQEKKVAAELEAKNKAAYEKAQSDVQKAKVKADSIQTVQAQEALKIAEQKVKDLETKKAEEERINKQNVEDYRASQGKYEEEQKVKEAQKQLELEDFRASQRKYEAEQKLKNSDLDKLKKELAETEVESSKLIYSPEELDALEEKQKDLKESIKTAEAELAKSSTAKTETETGTGTETGTEANQDNSVSNEELNTEGEDIFDPDKGLFNTETLNVDLEKENLKSTIANNKKHEEYLKQKKYADALQQIPIYTSLGQLFTTLGDAPSHIGESKYDIQNPDRAEKLNVDPMLAQIDEGVGTGINQISQKTNNAGQLISGISSIVANAMGLKSNIAMEKQQFDIDQLDKKAAGDLNVKNANMQNRMRVLDINDANRQAHTDTVQNMLSQVSSNLSDYGKEKSFQNIINKVLPFDDEGKIINPEMLGTDSVIQLLTGLKSKEKTNG